MDVGAGVVETDVGVAGGGEEFTSGGDDADIQTQKEWKAALTLKELLMHQAGLYNYPRIPCRLLSALVL